MQYLGIGRDIFRRIDLPQGWIQLHQIESITKTFHYHTSEVQYKMKNFNGAKILMNPSTVVGQNNGVLWSLLKQLCHKNS